MQPPQLMKRQSWPPGFNKFAPIGGEYKLHACVMPTTRVLPEALASTYERLKGTI